MTNLRIPFADGGTHRARITETLDLHSAAEIALYAVSKGISH